MHEKSARSEAGSETTDSGTAVISLSEHDRLSPDGESSVCLDPKGRCFITHESLVTQHVAGKDALSPLLLLREGMHFRLPEASGKHFAWWRDAYACRGTPGL